MKLEFLRMLTRLEINPAKMELMTSWERKGLEKGREEGIRNVAQKLLLMGMKMDNISETTGLSPEELEELKKKI